MTHDDYAQLLRSARSVLERYMFDGDSLRDDVAEICMKIDDALDTAAVQERAVASHRTEEPERAVA